ncbi:MAG: hypothetical protein IKR04_02150 [Clostridia bacterium]|nr:hypothetical protein [Clostridia bacterium]
MRETFQLNSKFALKYKDNGDVQLEGFAIHGGENFIVNGFYEVPESEMRNCTKTLQGKRLFKDHGTHSVDNIVGLVENTRTTYDEDVGMKGTKYKASLMVDDSRLGEKIERGLITDTSIGFDFTPICSICGNEFLSEKCTHHPLLDPDMHLICKDMNCHELSLVTFGADPGASVTSSFGGEDAEKLKAKFGKAKDEIMSDINNENLQSENIELKQKVSDLEAQLAAKDETHKTEIEGLKLTNQTEIATLQQEKEALESKVEEMSNELAEFRAEAQAKAEAELAAKKENLQKLAEELHVERTLGDVDEMSEEFIDQLTANYQEIIDNKAPEKPGEFSGSKQQHDKKEKKGGYSAMLKAFKGD